MKINNKFLVAVATAAAVTLAVTTLAAPGASAAGGDTTLAFQQTYPNPNAGYLAGASCLVPLGMVDGTAVGSVSACGVTTVFTPGTIKLSVPATWPLWGAAVQTEIPNPDVLWSNGSITLSLQFSSPRRFAGFEITPQAGTVQSFKAAYFDASGGLIGQINKTISGGKARLIGAKMFAATKVAEIRISSNGDFAIGRLRYKP